MKHGTLNLRRQLTAPRELVYAAWTRLEYRRHWFVGPGWTEIERSLDVKTGGHEIAHGRFPDGTETIYTARFHLVDPDARLIHAFDMHVAGKLFSVSPAAVDFEAASCGTVLTYTEEAFFFDSGYGAESRAAGTNGLLDQFTAYVSTLP